MNKLTNNKTHFCLGLSKPLDIFNNNVRKLIYFVLENNLYIHTSISYPINFFLFKFFLRKDRRHKIKFICKILANNLENFNRTVDLTLKKYSIKKIHILQLINLPISKNFFRDKDSLESSEFEKILNSIKELKKNEIIDKVYIQILSKDTLEFCKKMNHHFDGFAFYANINEINLKKEVYEFIIKNNIPSLILSVFGNPKESKVSSNLHLESYRFSQTFFSENTIPVGRTLNLSRLKDILNDNKINNLDFNPRFVETDEMQDTAENFYKRYKVTNLYYIFIFLVKCLTKKIIGQKAWLYLKSIYKKKYEN